MSITLLFKLNPFDIYFKQYKDPEDVGEPGEQLRIPFATALAGSGWSHAVKKTMKQLYADNMNVQGVSVEASNG